MNWKEIGEAFKSATGVSLAAALVLFATYGKQLIEAALAVPELYKSYANVLPMGVWSAALGTLLSAGFHSFARSWHRRSLAIELATILLGITVVTLQLEGSEPSDILSAIFVGGGAGLAGLYISKLIRSIRNRNDDEPRPDTPLPKSD